MREIKIAPSLLSADFSKLGEEARNLAVCGADIAHCDVMDGVFVNNLSFGVKTVSDLRKATDLPLDCHLMIVEPEKYVTRFAGAGADIITVHYEACGENLKKALEAIKATGKKCGVAINPDTPVSAIERLIPLCDMVLIMSVVPGFGGQKFMPKVLDKIRVVRAIADGCGKELDIEVDGGITVENVGLVKDAGANVIVAGSTVFAAQDRAAVIAELRNRKSEK